MTWYKTQKKRNKIKNSILLAVLDVHVHLYWSIQRRETGVASWSVFALEHHMSKTY
jgi:hypothetical protein